LHSFYSQAYVEFTSPQAATAVKQKIESYGEGQPPSKRHTVGFASPATNPFRTLPKDAPARQNGSHQTNRAGSGNFSGSAGQGNYNNGNNFRGRGGLNTRGGMNVNNNFNRNFQPPQMNAMPANGFGGPHMGGFAAAPMVGFNNFNRGGMMPMAGGFNNFNRGGMMPMVGMGGMPGRGGRGGMSMMGGGMPMGGMGMGMGMGGMPGKTL